MKMQVRLAVVAVLLATGVGLAIHHFHGHGHNHGTGAALKLDAGQKWESDPPLRAGMERIRDLVNAAEPTATPVEMQALSTGIQQQVDDLTTNCKLPPAADETLHVIIADLLDGAALVTHGEPQRGLSILQKALETYPKYFKHAGWPDGST